MIEVTKDGFTEPLNTYQNLIIDEEVNGNFTLSFTSVQSDNNPAHDLIEEECVINVDGYEFRAKQIKEARGRKEVVAISTYYDLIGIRKDEIFGGTRTFEQFADFIFKDTGWTYSSEVSGSVFIANFGDDNVIKLNDGLCYAFECEYKILPNNHVHFAKQIGPDNDAQYRYGHNVVTLSKNVDTTNLRTKITGYGGDGLKVTYTSPLADKYGIIEAEPISDDRFTIAASLTEHLKKALTDYPEVAFELDVVELADKEVGERIWLIYEPMSVEFQTRILSKRSTIRNGKWVAASVVLGNRTPKTLTDILASQRVEIDENRKQVMSRIEQTNERITLEIEEVDESIAGLEVTVGEVRIYAEQLESSIAEVDVKADSITLSVEELGRRLGSAESQLTIQAGEIASKVSETDYNGNTMISRINQTAGSITIQADRINLSGITYVADTLRIGNAGDGGSRRIILGGASSNVWIQGSGSGSAGVLRLNAANGYVAIDSAASFTGNADFSDRVKFNGIVDFSNATVIGLN